jgi:type IV pilus assembly protein PilB
MTQHDDASAGALERRHRGEVDPTFGPDVVEYVDLRPDDVERACFTIIDLDIARRFKCVPIEIDFDVITVALADASNLIVMDDLRLRLRPNEVRFVAADSGAIDVTLARWSREVARADESDAVRELAEEFIETDVEENTEEGRMAKLVATILEQAVIANASDVHIEPTEKSLQVRFRVDGVLVAHSEYPLTLSAGIANRLKVMAGLDIATRLIPQDGRFNKVLSDRTIDCRVVTLPLASHHEGVVVRLFDQSRSRVSLDRVGFHDTVIDQLTPLLELPHGLLLVTGPTGSGKTTTLYASLGIVARPDRKTLTIEDPVEIRLQSITQSQVNEKAGLTFASALRSFLRADPDVVLVGEIRDRETAALAAQAALTGHLVLSTLHTNEAAGAPTRLANLGLDGFVIASALKGVLAQRLLRKLCQKCATPYEPTAADLEKLHWGRTGLPTPERLNKAKGCPDCDHIGYRGRIPIGEVVTMNDEIAQAIIDRAPSAEIDRLALAAGTIPLHTDACAWAAEGLTSASEILRVGA